MSAIRSSALPTGRAYSTLEAAQYLSERGRRVSVSWLRKRRMRRADDPGDAGPMWFRDTRGNCVYFASDLDAYLERWRSTLRALQPAARARHLDCERGA